MYSQKINSNFDALTPSEYEVMSTIDAYLEKHNLLPNVKDIQLALEYKYKSSVYLLVRRLKAKGWLKYSMNKGVRHLRLKRSSENKRNKRMLEKVRENANLETEANFNLVPELACQNCSSREMIIRVCLLQVLNHFDEVHLIEDVKEFSTHARKVMLGKGILA